MELIADMLLVAGALGAGLYCFVLARRLRRFTDLEKGVGGAVSVLSAQADELKKSLDSAREASDGSGKVLRELTERAETVAQRLELMMASMHDVVPEAPAGKQDATDAVEESETSVEPEAPEEPEDMAAAIESTSPPASEAPEDPVKKPEGLMFFRHARAPGGAGS